MKTIRVKKEDKNGNLLTEFDLEVPETFEEMRQVPGEETALSYVVNQMKIAARASALRGTGEKKPREKGAKALLLQALKEGRITVEDVYAMLKARE